jgi:hypothetical protein
VVRWSYSYFSSLLLFVSLSHSAHSIKVFSNDSGHEGRQNSSQCPQRRRRRKGCAVILVLHQMFGFHPSSDHNVQQTWAVIDASIPLLTLFFRIPEWQRSLLGSLFAGTRAMTQPPQLLTGSLIVSFPPKGDVWTMEIVLVKHHYETFGAGEPPNTHAALSDHIDGIFASPPVQRIDGD